jgi:glycosyltransferase involved in cell wall biosynthesis
MNILLSHQPVVISGGAERATLDLGAALRELHHDVFLWGPWNSCPEFVSIASKGGIRIIDCVAITRWGEIRALRKACKTYAIDIVLSHGRRYNTLTPFAIRGSRTKHIPVVRAKASTWDEPRRKTFFYRLAHPFWNAFWLYMLASAPQIICISKAVASDVCKTLKCHESKTTMIYDAIGICSGDDSEHSQPQPSSPFRLVLVGRLQPVKRFHLVVPLMKEILRSDHDVCADLAGAGECRAEIDAGILEAGLGHHVKLLGHREDMGTVYRNAHVLVHFRSDEGFGRIYVEAQSLGLPVVCVRGGASEEVVCHGRTGYIHEDCDMVDMAASVLRLKHDRELYISMSRESRDWAKRFSVHRMAEQYESVFKTLVENARTEPRVSARNAGGEPRELRKL